MRDKRKTRTKDLARRHQSGAQECAACCALARQGQISLTSKIRTLDHLLEQAKLAAFMERAGVRHPVELRSFQPHVAPALNQSPMLASALRATPMGIVTLTGFASKLRQFRSIAL